MVEDEWWRPLLGDCPASDDGHTRRAHIASNNDGFVIEETDNEHYMFRLTDQQSTEASFKLYGLISDLKDGVPCAQTIRNQFLYYLICEGGIENVRQEVDRAQYTRDGYEFCAPIQRVLRQGFESIERRYFNSIDEDFAAYYRQRDLALNGAGTSDSMHQFQEAKRKVSGGASAAFAFVMANRLFVVSCGTTRALLLSQDEFGSVQVSPLNEAHDIRNPAERQRLLSLALRPEQLSCVNSPTRCFGNFLMKGGYMDDPKLSSATAEPCTVEPIVSGGHQIRPEHKFLVLVSPSVFTSIEQMGIQPSNVGQYLTQKISNAYTKDSNDISQLVLNDICDEHCLHQIQSARHPVPVRESMAFLCVSLNAGFQPLRTPAPAAAQASTVERANSVKKPNAYLVPSYVDFSTFESHPSREAVLSKVDRIFQEINEKRKLRRIEEDDQGCC
uniref:PPM-type phosphatase domain-containing protein n=1 Tax=Steinernema glaseri TaxID=37863 RepID=A0A1I7Z8T0_9BILA